MKGMDLILKNSELDFYNDSEKNKEICTDIKNKIIDTDLKLDYYKVKFSYKTKRGRKKQNHRFVIASNNEEAKFSFIEWINKFNKKYPARELLNVSILSCNLAGSTKLSLR